VNIVAYRQKDPDHTGPPKISKNADVDPNAEIGNGVEIGAFCVVGPNAKIGAGTKLANNVTVMGHVEIGKDNVISPNAVIGGEPQDISYRGTPTRVIIGDRNIIRECVRRRYNSGRQRQLPNGLCPCRARLQFGRQYYRWPRNHAGWPRSCSFQRHTVR